MSDGLCDNCFVLEEELRTCKQEKDLIIYRYKRLRRFREKLEDENNQLREDHNLFIAKLKDRMT